MAGSSGTGRGETLVARQAGAGGDPSDGRAKIGRGVEEEMAGEDDDLSQLPDIRSLESPVQAV